MQTSALGIIKKKLASSSAKPYVREVVPPKQQDYIVQKVCAMCDPILIPK